MVYGKDSTEHKNKIRGENTEIVYTTDGGRYGHHLKWLNRCSLKKIVSSWRVLLIMH